MTVDDYDLKRIPEILNGEGDWFSAQLIRLIGKADDGNRERLRIAFPDHVAAFDDWYHQRGHYAPERDEVAS